MSGVGQGPVLLGRGLVEPAIVGVKLLRKGGRVRALDLGRFSCSAHHGVKSLPCLPCIASSKFVLHLVFVLELGSSSALYSAL